MRKQFIGNLVFLQLLNLLVKPLWIFLIDREVQNLLGEKLYGSYFIHLNFILLFIIILDIGIQTFNTKAVSEDPSFFRRHFKTFILLKIALSALYLGLTAGMGFLRGLDITWLMALGFNQVLAGFVLYFRSNLAGMKQYKADSVLSVTDKIISIIICTALLFSEFRSEFNIRWFIAAQNTGMGIALLAALWLNLRALKKTTPYPASDQSLLSPGRQLTTMQLIRQSLPYALLIALMSLYTRIDATMIDALAANSDTEAGLYAQGFRLLDAAAMFAMLFSGLLLPMFSSLLAQQADLRPLTYLAGKILFLGSVAVAIGCFCYSEQIMRLLYHFEQLPQLLYSAEMFGWIMASFIPMCLVYVFGTLLTARGDITYLNRFALASVVANILLNTLLIPHYNALGAAIATLITQGLFGLLCVIRCFRVFGFKADMAFVLRSIIYVFALTGVYFISKSLPFALALSVFGLSTLVLLSLLRFFRPSQLLQLLKSEN